MRQLAALRKLKNENQNYGSLSESAASPICDHGPVPLMTVVEPSFVRTSDRRDWEPVPSKGTQPFDVSC